jgi:hypothetical protein
MLQGTCILYKLCNEIECVEVMQLSGVATVSYLVITGINALL